MKELINDTMEKLKAGKKIQLEYNDKKDEVKMLVIKTKKYNVYELKEGEKSVNT